MDNLFSKAGEFVLQTWIIRYPRLDNFIYIKVKEESIL